MVIVDMHCLRSFSKIRREPLMHNTSDAIMLQFISQNGMIYSIKRSLKIVKNVVKHDIYTFFCPCLFLSYSPCPKFHAEYKISLYKAILSFK